MTVSRRGGHRGCSLITDHQMGISSSEGKMEPVSSGGGGSGVLLRCPAFFGRFLFFLFFLFYSHFWFTASCGPDWTTILTAEFNWRQTYSAVVGLLCDSAWQDVFVFVFAGRFLCKISNATLFQSSGMKVPLVNGSTNGAQNKEIRHSMCRTARK